MKGLYRFQADFGRAGSVEGVFVATKSQVKKALGKQIYLGEVLGKHSEVVLDPFSEEDIALLTDDQEFIAKAIEYGLTDIGINPLNYLES